MNERSKNWLLPLVSLCFALFYFWLNRFGPAVTHDSIFYLNGADYWRETGVFQNMHWGPVGPELHYAPLFSAVMALMSWVFQTNAQTVAIWLMPLLACLNLYLIGRLFQLSGLSIMRSLALTIIVGFSFVFHSIHWHVWSEPLYLTLLLLTAHCMMRWQDSDVGWYWILAASLAGCSVLVRYAGLFMLPLFVLWLFLQSSKNRWRNSVIFSIIALLPYLAWLLRNKAKSGELGSRNWEWNWVGMGEFTAAFQTVFYWGCLSVLILALIFIMIRRRSFISWVYASWFVGALGYVFLLVLAKSWADPQIPMDTRMLSPLLLPILLLIGHLFKHFQTRSFYLVIICSGLMALWQFMPVATKYYAEGWGFNARSWHAADGPVDQISKQLPEGARLFATDMDAHYLSYLLQRPIDYFHFGDTMQYDTYYVRLLADLPRELTTVHAEELVEKHLWYRKPNP